MADACRSHELERVFDRIRTERMADVPILNNALRVEAVGFRHWEDQCLGVLITPWFMNLVLLPLETVDAPRQPVGDTRSYRFPAGDFEFMRGGEPGIGGYQSCSLFSPVFEFEDHETAVKTARTALEALFEPPGEANIAEEQASQDPMTRPEGAPPAGPAQALMKRPISRRDLLRGNFPGRRRYS